MSQFLDKCAGRVVTRTLHFLGLQDSSKLRKREIVSSFLTEILLALKEVIETVYYSLHGIFIITRNNLSIMLKQHVADLTFLFLFPFEMLHTASLLQFLVIMCGYPYILQNKDKSTRVAFSVQNRVGKTLLVYFWPFWTTLFCCLTLVTQAKYLFFMIGQLLKVLVWCIKASCEINSDELMFLHRLTRKPETELTICLSKLAVLVKMLKMMGGRRACTSSLAWYFYAMSFNFDVYGKLTASAPSHCNF